LPLPPPATGALPDYVAIQAALQPLLEGVKEQQLAVKAAWACASTFRHTDYQGGCNGARLRFAPQKDWQTNIGLDKWFTLLEPVKRAHGEALSWADLIVLAATMAVSQQARKPSLALQFCPGRTDALGAGTLEQQMSQRHLAPRVHANESDSILQFRLSAALIGLTDREIVALKQQVWRANSRSSGLDNTYYRALLDNEWVRTTDGYEPAGKPASNMTMLKTDLILRWDAAYLAIAQEYASDEDVFLAEFGAAWTKVVNADRFDGPASSACDAPGANIPLAVIA